MESDAIYLRYVSSRATAYRRLDSLREEIDAWLAARAGALPSMAELAQLEALHGERHRLLLALHEAEERFLDHVIDLIDQSRRST